MTTDDLIADIDVIFHERLLPLLRNKNSDYAGNEDAFSNFREFGFLGLLVRMGDKFSRLKNIHHNTPAVKNESFIDTLEDLVNYGLIALSMLNEEGENE